MEALELASWAPPVAFAAVQLEFFLIFYEDMLA